jgi:hypothetical protein
MYSKLVGVKEARTVIVMLEVHSEEYSNSALISVHMSRREWSKIRGFLSRDSLAVLNIIIPRAWG